MTMLQLNDSENAFVQLYAFIISNPSYDERGQHNAVYGEV